MCTEMKPPIVVSWSRKISLSKREKHENQIIKTGINKKRPPDSDFNTITICRFRSRTLAGQNTYWKQYKELEISETQNERLFFMILYLKTFKLNFLLS